MKLWEYNRITGFWVYCRDCLPENAETWLIVWQADNPDGYFKLAKNRPNKAPKLRPFRPL